MLVQIELDERELGILDSVRANPGISTRAVAVWAFPGMKVSSAYGAACRCLTLLERAGQVRALSPIRRQGKPERAWEAAA